MQNSPGRVYVISLDRTPERLQAFRERFPANWPYAYPVQFVATDGERCVPPAAYIENAAAWGCLQSWCRVLETAIANRLSRPVLVFEDDAQLTSDAVQRIPGFLASLPDGWEIAYLGGAHCQQPQPVAQGIVRCVETSRTHALAVHPRAFLMLLTFWRAYRGHADHGLQALAEADNRRFYAADPFIAFQASNYSTIKRQLEPARSWDHRVRVNSREPAAVPVVLLSGSRDDIDRLRDTGTYHTGSAIDPQTGRDRNLIAMMLAPADEQAANLAEWIRVERQYAADFPTAAVGVWHPLIGPELLNAALVLVRS